MWNNLSNIRAIIAGKRVKTQLADDDLVIVGLKDESYDGGYKDGAISKADLAAQLVPVTPGPVIDSEGNLIVADSSNDTVIVLNGDSHLIPDFSGMLMVNDHFGGRVELWIAGSGDAVLVSYTQVSGGAPTNTLVMSGNGYEWTNNDNFGNNGDIGITFTVIKTRQGS